MNGSAAGQDTSYSTPVDTKDCDSVVLLLAIGAIAASGTITLTAQGGAASNGSDAVNLEGSEIEFVADDANKIAQIEIHRPQHRYNRLKIVRETANSVIDGGFAILRDPKEIPITIDSTVKSALILASPDEVGQ
jgi:hypothetical protein